MNSSEKEKLKYQEHGVKIFKNEKRQINKRSKQKKRNNMHLNNEVN
ncbi:30090_t:CDS:1, partial [Racocetra persica]